MFFMMLVESLCSCFFHSTRNYPAAKVRHPTGARGGDRGREAQPEMSRQRLPSNDCAVVEGQEGAEIWRKYQNHLRQWDGLPGGRPSLTE